MKQPVGVILDVVLTTLSGRNVHLSTSQVHLADPHVYSARVDVPNTLAGLELPSFTTDIKVQCRPNSFLELSNGHVLPVSQLTFRWEEDNLYKNHHIYHSLLNAFTRPLISQEAEGDPTTSHRHIYLDTDRGTLSAIPLRFKGAISADVPDGLLFQI